MGFIGNDWDELLKDEFKSEYMLKMFAYLRQEYSLKEIFPPKKDVFNAFKLTPFSNIKIVILGQDPYHNFGEAMGLAFSVRENIKIPPSLVNIFKELKTEMGFTPASSGNLENWARQGVLLLNTVLTVEKNKPNSHKNIGWTTFTDSVIKIINQKEQPVVFMLWGNNAKSKKSLINSSSHLVLESAHPSPLSCYNGFFGCNHFILANQFLEKNHIPKIDFKL